MHIAAPADFLAEDLAPRLAPLIAAGLDLRLHSGDRQALYAMLLEDRVHLAVTASRPDDRRLAFEPIGSERLLAVAAPAMVGIDALLRDPAQSLPERPHVAYDLDRPLLREWLAANGYAEPTAPPVATAADLRVLRAMLCAGIGWSVLPDYLTVRERADGRLVEIPAPRAVPENVFHLVWARAQLRHPRVARARDLLLAALGRTGAPSPVPAGRR